MGTRNTRDGPVCNHIRHVDSSPFRGPNNLGSHVSCSCMSSRYLLGGEKKGGCVNTGMPNWKEKDLWRDGGALQSYECDPRDPRIVYIVTHPGEYIGVGNGHPIVMRLHRSGEIWALRGTVLATVYRQDNVEIHLLLTNPPDTSPSCSH